MSRRGLRGTVGVLAVTAVVGAALSALVPTAGAAEPTGSTGPVTRTAADGPFRGLEVTVSQTSSLINQVVDVSWKGGAETVPTTGRFGLNYLQIMQCWGDDPSGPRREQCQYGGRTGDNRGGSFATSRQTSYGDSLVDPQETYRQEPGSNRQANVPFESVTGKTSSSGLSEFYDASTTNEVTYARTRSGGRGAEPFEIQTGLEAPGLGCGAKTTPEAATATATATAARPCWLVVVPRGATEVDGSLRSGSGAFELQSSPLSASNWEHRIVFPLQFEPLGTTCAQTSERRLVGQELFTEAITRWQPSLCANGGATYGWSQVTDAFARTQLTTSSDPGLVVLGDPADPARVEPSRPVIYAPLALQGLSISFLVERVPVPSAPAPVREAGGLPIEDLRLTPRLVAKLLTQSYRNATPDNNPVTEKNPEQIIQDREFLALNPEFSDLIYIALSDVVVPVGQADAFAQVWAWIDADREARDWLDGTPDEQGMTVNPAYKGIELPVTDFPKSDAHCRNFIDDRLPLCTLERRPFAADLQEAGRAAGRGENLSRQSWDPLATPPQWRRTEPQPNGSRSVLALTDTATAHRYGLRAARLRNAAGTFVAPDDKGLLAGLAAMTPSEVAGVLTPAPAGADPGAYPLTTLSYAATAPAMLTEQAGAEYAALLEYAAGPGQVSGVLPGNLPEGYVPLPDAQRVQLRAAAATIRETAGKPVEVAAAPEEPAAEPEALPLPSTLPGGLTGGSSFGSDSFGSGSFSDSSSSFGSGSGSTLAADGGGSLEQLLADVGPAEADGGAPAPVALASTGTTPGSPLGAARLWLPALLILGVTAGLLAPALTRMRPVPALPA